MKKILILKKKIIIILKNNKNIIIGEIDTYYDYINEDIAIINSFDNYKREHKWIGDKEDD